MPEENDNTNGTEEITVDNSADPVSADGGQEASFDIDSYSRYGDVVPDSIDSLLPSGSEGGGEEIPPVTDGTAAPSPDGQGQDNDTPAPQPGTQQPQPADGSDAQQASSTDPLTEVKGQIAELTNLLSSQATQQQNQEQQAEATPLDSVPDYNFEVPDQLVSMLASEDAGERKQAIAALVRGTAQTVHQQMLEVVKHVQESVPNTIQQHVQQQQVQQQVNTEFYGKYPQLNNPNLRPVVAKVAQGLMQQQLAVGIQPSWSPQFMEQVGGEVLKLLNMQQQAPAATPAPAVQPATTPAMFGGNNGGGANQNPRLAKGRMTQQQYMDEL